MKCYFNLTFQILFFKKRDKLKCFSGGGENLFYIKIIIDATSRIDIKKDVCFDRGSIGSEASI